MTKKTPKLTAFEKLKEAAAATIVPTIQPPLAMTVQQSSPNLWQIVLAGTIDPRQHHPLWYQLIGAITPEEAKDAQTKSPSMSGPNLSLFDVGAFAVISTPDQWAIQTVTEANRSRMIDVAARVLIKLNEITVRAFGINRQAAIPVQNLTAQGLLTSAVSLTHWPLPSGQPVGAAIVYSTHSDLYDTHIQISPADNSLLAMTFNRSYPIRPPSPPTNLVQYVDVAKLIRENAEPAWNDAAKYVVQLSNYLRNKGA